MLFGPVDSEPVMFDDSDSDAGVKGDELFKPISQLKPAAKKPAAKKPAGEKKPKAPPKKKAEKKGISCFICTCSKKG